MNAALIAGMLLAYTAALCPLIRKACSARKSYLAEKILCSLLFVAVAGVSAKLGSRPEAFVHLSLIHIYFTAPGLHWNQRKTAKGEERMGCSQPEGQKPWACACCAMEAAELAQTCLLYTSRCV